MAIVDVFEKWEQMTFSESAGQGLTGTRVFQAITDDGASGSATNVAQVLADTRIPAILTSFPGYPDCLCTERTPARTGASREEWLVTLNYKSEMTKDEKEKNKPPLERAAQIVWTSQKTMKPMRKMLFTDFYQVYTGTVADNFHMASCTNSATDPFDPPLEYPFTEWIATITKKRGSHSRMVPHLRRRGE